MVNSGHFPNHFIETPIMVHPEDVPGKFSMPITRLNNLGLDVEFGLRRDDVPALTEIAKQTATLEYCPNDVARRWGNKTMAERQVAKDGGRAVMRLVSREDGSTLGFGWTGAMSDAEKEHLPKCTTTFAIRLHEDAQGKHLALPFTQAIVATTMAFCRARRIGLETWGSNRGAVRTYLKAGAELVDVESSSRPTLRQRGPGVFRTDGVPHVNDVRLYMQFPHTM